MNTLSENERECPQHISIPPHTWTVGRITHKNWNHLGYGFCTKIKLTLLVFQVQHSAFSPKSILAFKDLQSYTVQLK